MYINSFRFRSLFEGLMSGSSKNVFDMRYSIPSLFCQESRAGEHRPRQRYGEAFWRAHHEAWERSDLNQREYCEAQGIPLKAFGNWRTKFQAEPQPPQRKLLYRRRGLSNTISHSLSHALSHTLNHVMNCTV